MKYTEVTLRTRCGCERKVSVNYISPYLVIPLEAIEYPISCDDLPPPVPANRVFRMNLFQNIDGRRVLIYQEVE